MRIYLMANDWPGSQVAKILLENGDQIERLYLHPADLQKDVEAVKVNAKVADEQIYDASVVNDPAHLSEVQNNPPDFIITVFWSFLLKPEFFNLAKNTLNFHPALLPINRGWYPHVHSIIDGSPTGVTLHAINEKADSGPIWVQKEVALRDSDTAFEIYHRLQKEIVELFREQWPLIKTGKVQPAAQDESRAVYHKKRETEQLDMIDLEKEYTAKEFIDLLRARSFGDRGFAYIEKDGRKFYLNIKISPESKGDQKEDGL